MNEAAIEVAYAVEQQSDRRKKLTKSTHHRRQQTLHSGYGKLKTHIQNGMNNADVSDVLPRKRVSRTRNSNAKQVTMLEEVYVTLPEKKLKVLDGSQDSSEKPMGILPKTQTQECA